MLTTRVDVVGGSAGPPPPPRAVVTQSEVMTAAAKVLTRTMVRLDSCCRTDAGVIGRPHGLSLSTWAATSLINTRLVPTQKHLLLVLRRPRAIVVSSLDQEESYLHGTWLPSPAAMYPSSSLGPASRADNGFGPVGDLPPCDDSGDVGYARPWGYEISGVRWTRCSGVSYVMQQFSFPMQSARGGIWCFTRVSDLT